MAVNWSKPIEAVHKDGQVASVVFDNGPTGSGYYWIKDGGEPEDCALYFEKDGNPASERYTTWRIRNVQPAAAKPAISDELVERMVALVREMARAPLEDRGAWSDEAAAIADFLPHPSDPDDVEAKMLAENGPLNRVEVITAAIKRGRALERGEP